MSHTLQVTVDIVHVGVAQENPGEVFLADGGHTFGVGEELYLEHLCLQVVHESGSERWTTAADKEHQQLTKEHLTPVTRSITEGPADDRPSQVKTHL